MGFNALIEKVHQAEVALEGKERLTSARWQQAKVSWRSAWTPGRIVIAGLVGGFIVGRAEPFKRAAGGGTLQLISALTGLFAGGSAQAAAGEAEKAAEAATGENDLGVQVAAAQAASGRQAAGIPDDDTFDYAVEETMRTPESLRRAGLL